MKFRTKRLSKRLSPVVMAAFIGIGLTMSAGAQTSTALLANREVSDAVSRADRALREEFPRRSTEDKRDQALFIYGSQAALGFFTAMLSPTYAVKRNAAIKAEFEAVKKDVDLNLKPLENRIEITQRDVELLRVKKEALEQFISHPKKAAETVADTIVEERGINEIKQATLTNELKTLEELEQKAQTLNPADSAEHKTPTRVHSELTLAKSNAVNSLEALKVEHARLTEELNEVFSSGRIPVSRGGVEVGKAASLITQHADAEARLTHAKNEYKNLLARMQAAEAKVTLKN